MKTVLNSHNYLSLLIPFLKTSPICMTDNNTFYSATYITQGRVNVIMNRYVVVAIISV